jgi:hypothetical protein
MLTEASLLIASAQTCECPCPEEPEPTTPGEPDPNDPCLLEPDNPDRPFWCPVIDPNDPGTPFTDPCQMPDAPWYCNPDAYAEHEAVVDEETAFNFSEFRAAYTLDDRRIKYRIGIPLEATAVKPYDVVIQMAAPIDVGWAAIAWGGGMVDNPLTVAWANCSNVVLSSRWTP